MCQILTNCLIKATQENLLAGFAANDHIGPKSQIILSIQLSDYFFLSINLNICYRCSEREQSQCDDSFENPQQMFWFRSEKGLPWPN